MFGKPVLDYLKFQRSILILIAVVWALRFGLSLAGVTSDTVKFVSITALLLIGAVYYARAVHDSGFGGYKQLLALCWTQGVFSQTLIAIAIVVGILGGQDNVFTLPEFYPPSAGDSPLPLPLDGKNWGHAAAHIFFAGAIMLPLIGWALSSATLAVLRKVRPAGSSV